MNKIYNQAIIEIQHDYKKYVKKVYEFLTDMKMEFISVMQANLELFITMKCKKDNTIYSIKLLHADRIRKAYLYNDYDMSMYFFLNPNKYFAQYKTAPVLNLKENYNMYSLQKEYIPGKPISFVKTKSIWKTIVKQIIEACGYMEKNKIQHNDLTENNILYHKGNITIIDYEFMVDYNKPITRKLNVPNKFIIGYDLNLILYILCYDLQIPLAKIIIPHIAKTDYIKEDMPSLSYENISKVLYPKLE